MAIVNLEEEEKSGKRSCIYAAQLILAAILGLFKKNKKNYPFYILISADKSTATNIALAILLDLTKYRKSIMDKESLIQFLQNTNLVTFQKATEISNHFTYREIGKNEFFLKEGKICNEYLFLENGFMRAFAFNTGGNDVTTNFYSNNQVVFEVSSFFNRTI